MKLKYKECLYVDCDPFEGDREINIRNKTVKIVKVRKQQDCYGIDKDSSHQIEVGKLARLEKAIVDEKWESYYICIKCMEQWFEQEGIGEPD